MSWRLEDLGGYPAGFWTAGAHDGPNQLRFYDTLPSTIPRRGYKRSEDPTVTTPSAMDKLVLTDFLFTHADGTPLTYTYTGLSIPAGTSPLPTTDSAGTTWNIPYGHYSVKGYLAGVEVEGGFSFTFIRDSSPACPKVLTDAGIPEAGFALGGGIRIEASSAFINNGTWPANIGDLEPYVNVSNALYPGYLSAARRREPFVTWPDLVPGNSTHVSRLQATAAHYGPLGLHLHGLLNEPNSQDGGTYPPPSLALATLYGPLKAALHAGDPDARLAGPEGVSVGKYAGGLAAFMASGISEVFSNHWYNNCRDWMLLDRASTLAAVETGKPTGEWILSEAGDCITAQQWFAVLAYHTAAILGQIGFFEGIGVLASQQCLFKVQAADGFGYTSTPGHPSWFHTHGGQPYPAATILAHAFTHWWRSGVATRLDVGEADRYTYQALRYTYVDAPTTGWMWLLGHGHRTTRVFHRSGGSGAPTIRDAVGNDLTAGATADFNAKTYKSLGGGDYEIPLGPYPVYVELAAGEAFTVTSTDTFCGPRVNNGVAVTFSSGTVGGVDPNRIIQGPQDARYYDRSNNDAVTYGTGIYAVSAPRSTLSPGHAGHVETVQATFAATAVRRATWYFPVGRGQDAIPRTGTLQRRVGSTWQDVYAFDHGVTVIPWKTLWPDGANGYVAQIGYDVPQQLHYDDPAATSITGLRILVDAVTYGEIPGPEPLALDGPDPLAYDDNLGVTVKHLAIYPAGTTGGGGGGGGSPGDPVTGVLTQPAP